MGFGDLKSQKGQQSLNDYLADKSYIEGYVASQADAVVFKALSGAPDAKLAHLLRWFNHLKSYGSQRDCLPGIAKQLTAYGPAEAAGASDGDDDDDDDDDDVDLFGESSQVDEEFERQKKERLAEYEAKKTKKPAVIAKSIVIMEVKPWGDETDMKALEDHVRGIEMDGLRWCASKLVEVGYGIKKLQINCVVVDDKVSTYDLEEMITANEDLVQSVDIVAFNKV